MIKFRNLSKEKPYKVFEKQYHEALKAKQDKIEAICISSYSIALNEVNARFVNLKIIDDKNFIFFTNYESPKSKEFQNFNQISAVIYWNTTNVQIRLKGRVKKTCSEFNNNYFRKRDLKKNALAISSKQSSRISSYEDVQKNFIKSLENENLYNCPDYWGGYFFEPYYFEFWEGHNSRINKRIVYEVNNGKWDEYYLQP